MDWELSAVSLFPRQISFNEHLYSTNYSAAVLYFDLKKSITKSSVVLSVSVAAHIM